MGFWGTYIVARADQPLPKLPALQPSAESIIWHGRGPDGWQAVRVHRGPDGWASSELPARWEATLRVLMEQAVHPVLAAVIMDSDGAQLIGYSPVAGRWGGWLMLDRMHAVGPPAPDAAPLAVTWASEAGLQPDPVAVEAALEASDVFCEDVFFGLLAALGVPDLTSEVTSA